MLYSYKTHPADLAKMNGTMTRNDLLRTIAAGSITAASLTSKSAVAEDAAVPQIPAKIDKPLTVAFVVGAHANVMDLAGPWEVFQDSSGTGWSVPSFTLYTISDGRKPIQGTGGLSLVPTYAFGDSRVPQPNVIAMGAQGDHTSAKIDWIRSASAKADVVMSVCTGAFLLAQTGLVDGLEATTHHEFYDRFAAQHPNVKLKRNVRYVENSGGKFCSAGGITSGIELALRVVERYLGAQTSAETALYMEYVRSRIPPTNA